MLAHLKTSLTLEKKVERVNQWSRLFIGSNEQPSQAYTGVSETGGRGATAPPHTFAEISPKFLQDKDYFLKFLFFAPPPTFGLALPLVDKFQHPCNISFKT